VDQRRHIQYVVIDVWRGDDQRSQQSPLHLVVRELVRVVPVRPDLVGHEPVRKRRAGQHGVLCDTGDAVHGVGDVQTVPVQRDAARDVRVLQPDLDELALHSTDARPR
jgi:hypothetical protein